MHVSDLEQGHGNNSSWELTLPAESLSLSPYFDFQIHSDPFNTEQCN
jgi:hypothetical protein